MTALPLTSRFHMVEKPVAHPGKCIVCGAVDRACIDFGMDIDDYGAVYFCFDCMREGGLAAGLIHPSMYEQAQLGAEQSLHDYLKTRDLRIVTSGFVECFNRLLDSLPNAFPDTHVHLGNVDSKSIDDAYQRSRQELLPLFESDNSGSGQDDSTPSDERPTSISGSTGFGDLFDPFHRDAKF